MWGWVSTVTVRDARALVLYKNLYGFYLSSNISKVAGTRACCALQWQVHDVRPVLLYLHEGMIDLVGNRGIVATMGSMILDPVCHETP